MTDSAEVVARLPTVPVDEDMTPISQYESIPDGSSAAAQRVQLLEKRAFSNDELVKILSRMADHIDQQNVPVFMAIAQHPNLHVGSMTMVFELAVSYEVEAVVVLCLLYRDCYFSLDPTDKSDEDEEWKILKTWDCYPELAAMAVPMKKRMERPRRFLRN